MGSEGFKFALATKFPLSAIKGALNNGTIATTYLPILLFSYWQLLCNIHNHTHVGEIGVRT